MKQKDLSSTVKNLLSTMPNTPLALMRYFLNRFKHQYSVRISQRQLAEVIEPTQRSLDERTIRSWIGALVERGLLIVVHRKYKEVNIYAPGPLLSNKLLHDQFYHWFDRYPSYLSIGLLFVSQFVTQVSCYYPDTKNVFKKQTFFTDRVTMVGGEMSIEVPYSDKIRGICAALKKRGADISNDDALNMTAFTPETLGKVIEVMKTARNIQNIKPFFFGLCRKFAVQAGESPDWTKVQLLVDRKVRLLNKLDEGKDPQPVNPVTLNADQQYNQKRDHCKQTYMNQVREIMGKEKKLAEERRAPMIENKNVEIEQVRKDLEQAEYLMNSGNEFAKYTVKGLRYKLNCLLGVPEEMLEATRVGIPNGVKFDRSEGIVAHASHHSVEYDGSHPHVKFFRPMKSAGDVLRGSPFVKPEQVPDTLPMTKSITQLFQVESITVEAVYEEGME